MSYKIKINDLKQALLESANKRKADYQDLKFVENIFKENKEHIKNIKKIIRESRDNGKKTYNYLLHECNCASKYDKLTEYMPYDEEVMLYDLDEHSMDMDDEDYHNREHPHDMSIYYDLHPFNYGIESRQDKNTAKNRYVPGKDSNLDDTGFPTEEPIIPEYWVAEQMFEGTSDIKKAHMGNMSEQDILSEVKKMEEQGYNVTAFMTEEEMNDYLNNDSLYESFIKESEVNPNYKTFVVRKATGEIFDGYEDDISEVRENKEEFNDDLRGRGEKPSDFKLVSAKSLQRKNIDPYDVKNWETNKKKIDEIDSNLPPDFNQSAYEDAGYEIDYELQIDDYPLLKKIANVVSMEFVESMIEDFGQDDSSANTLHGLVDEIKSVLMHGTGEGFSTLLSNNHIDVLIDNKYDILN